MNDAERFKGIDFPALFAAGAASAAIAHGMSEKDAEAFTMALCKDAAARRVQWDEDEEEGDTFWSRNKKWLIPTLVGSLAFWVGADAERNGRKDRGYVSNALGQLWKRTKILLGMNNDNPAMKAVTQMPKEIPEVKPTGEAN